MEGGISHRDMQAFHTFLRLSESVFQLYTALPNRCTVQYMLESQIQIVRE